MEKYLAIGQKIEDIVIVTSFIVMVLLAFLQVVNRNTVGYSIAWFEELARYCMVYMALLGTEAGLRDGSQIAITFVKEKFHGIPRAVLDILIKVIIVAFSIVVFYFSFGLLENQLSLGQESPAFGLPMYIPYLALPFSFGIISLVQGVTLIIMVVNLFSGKHGQTGGGAA